MCLHHANNFIKLYRYENCFLHCLLCTCITKYTQNTQCMKTQPVTRVHRQTPWYALPKLANLARLFKVHRTLVYWQAIQMSNYRKQLLLGKRNKLSIIQTEIWKYEQLIRITKPCSLFSMKCVMLHFVREKKVEVIFTDNRKRLNSWL